MAKKIDVMTIGDLTEVLTAIEHTDQGPAVIAVEDARRRQLPSRDNEPAWWERVKRYPTHRRYYTKKGDDVHQPRRTGHRVHGAIGRNPSECASVAQIGNEYRQTVETEHSANTR